MPTFKNCGADFNYVDIGDGVPFIFQHGLGGDLTQPYSLIAPVEGFRFLSFDFRGHGDTSAGFAESDDFNVFADDLLRFMDVMKLEKAVVGGISMGGGVAINFTMRYRERVKGFVIFRPAWLDAPMSPDIREMFDSVASLIEGYEKNEGCEILKKQDWFHRLEKKYPAAAHSFLSMFEYKKAKETVSKYRKLPSDKPCSDRGGWRNIDVPVLIVANDNDPVHPLEYGKVYGKYITGSQYYEVTSKSEDEDRHKKESRAVLTKYLADSFLHTTQGKN